MSNRLMAVFMMLQLVIGPTISLAEPNRPIVISEKGQASYGTPENALNAFFSAYMAGDLEWHYQTLTEAAAAEKKADFERNQLDPMAELAIFRRGFVQGVIAESLDYLDARVLVVRITDDIGDQFLLPYTLVMEEGEWKVTNKYSASEALEPYVDFIPKLYLNP